MTDFYVFLHFLLQGNACFYRLPPGVLALFKGIARGSRVNFPALSLVVKWTGNGFSSEADFLSTAEVQRSTEEFEKSPCRPREIHCINA